MNEDSVYYESYKEERDLVLEYNQVSFEDVNVVNINGIGIDNMSRTQAVVKIMNMIKDGGVHHVICLNPYKLQRIKYNGDLKLISNKADLRLPSGAGLEWAAKLLKTPLKERIDVLSLMMDLVRISEIKEYTLFMVGARPEIIEQAYFNIRKSFPKIRIVGRHGGYFSSEREVSVIEAIRKSEANIVFVGLGFPKEEKWIYSIKNEFKNTIFLSVGGSIDVISGDIKKAPPFFMERGLDWFYRIISKPWRVGRIFMLKLFFIQVIWSRIFMKKK
jgi:N-acetylglucosaminyldiphosphoundecaprenol N-acetyl-beta-D-mannosaminyltransferase